MMSIKISDKFAIRNSQFEILPTQLSTPLIVTLAYMLLLLILSSIPGGREDGFLASPTLANIAHVPAYGLLALLWVVTLRDRGVTEHRSMFVAFLVSAAYGALTELNQVWIPGRYASASDVMFDVAGSLIFIWLYWFVSGERRVSSVESRVSKVESKEGALTSKLSTSS